MRMPVLEGERLLVRPFVPDDLDAIHDLLDVQLAEADVGTEGVLTRAERERWLQWSVLNEQQLAYMKLPPYGDRPIVHKDTDAIIGACGFVPCIGPFGQLPSGEGEAGGRFSTEFGLYWSVAPAWQRQGIATEAARLLVEHAFECWHLGRIVAMTSDENVASRRVMEKLGMRIERNPRAEPPWFQIVGILDHPSTRS